MIPPSPPTALDSRSQIVRRIISPTGLAVTALIGIMLVFYHGLWQPNLVLIKRDAFRFYLPIKQYLIERLSQGELPEWFPYEGLGRSFIGSTHTGVFHPFSALYFLYSVPDAYRASTLLSCLLAALGAFVLGRRLNFSSAGALTAGLAFGLSGYVVSLTDHIVYLYSICLLPFFCAALEKALVGNRPWVVAPAALWATVFLNGDVQTGYYYIFIALAWVLARAPGSYWEAGRRLALVGLLAALLAGIQLGPTWALFAQSERTHSTVFHEQAFEWSTPPLRLMTMLASPIGQHADPVVVARVFFGLPKKGFWAESLYLGVPVIGLALLGAWSRRDLKVFALLGSLALLLSLGRYGGLYEPFYKTVPLWSAFRYPEKLMGFVAFSTAMLAGAGLDALRARTTWSVPWFAAPLTGSGLVRGLWTEAATAWTAAFFGASLNMAREMTRSAAFAFFWSALAAGGVGVLIRAIRRGLLPEMVLLSALVMLIALDLSRANLVTYHTGPTETASFVPPLAEAIQRREGSPVLGRFRIVSMHEDLLIWPQSLMAALDHYGAASVERRQALDAEHNAQFGLETVLPYLPGYSKQFAETLSLRAGTEAAARLNVKYYIGRRYHLKDPRLAQGLVAQLPPYDLALFENPTPAKPRVYLSRQPERATGRVDPESLFAKPDFLSGEADFIETDDARVPGPAEEGIATIERYAPEDVRVRVETPQPAVLILLDAFDKGWTARLETDDDIPILRANALVRAVVVPAGAHAVTFSYQTPLLKAGAGASFAGVLLCLGLIVHARRRSADRRPD